MSDSPADHPVRLSVVIPAYQEAERVGTAVAQLRDHLAPLVADGLEIIVVDDGSADGTASAARAAGADEVITLAANRGKGAAVRAGVLAARGRTIAYTDADLAYSPDQLLSLLAAVEAGADVVTGSRRNVDTITLVRRGRLREVSGRLFSLMAAWLVLEGKERDTQCGLKAFSAGAADELFRWARVDGFAFDVELFLLAQRRGLSVAEVPVSVSNRSASSVSVALDGLRMIRDLLRIRRWDRAGAYNSGVARPHN